MLSHEEISSNHDTEQSNRPTIIVPGKWVGISIDQPRSDAPEFTEKMINASEIADFPNPNNYQPDPYGPEANHDYYDSI